MIIGCYRDSTGWGQATIDYALALDAVGVDVVLRPIRLNNANVPLPERILQLEQKSSAGSEVVVQHTLPHLYDYNGNLHNVALYASETSDFCSSPWADRINTMDHAVVINRQMEAAARYSGVTIPISVVPHATDITRFQRGYEPLERLKPLKDDGQFIFYTMGEFVRRKNLGALIKAFHTEFDPSEPVQLVIKSSKPGLAPNQCKAEIEKVCQDIKRALKLHGGKTDLYKQEIIITERLTEQGVMRLHSSCDVFVQPSYGEAWSIPAFDAMAMGKTPIVTGCTGYLDYVSDATGWLVNCRPEPVFAADDTFADLFVGSETWSSADVMHLRQCMREAFVNRDLTKTKSTNGIAKAYDFSYKAVGQKLKEALEHGRTALDTTT